MSNDPADDERPRGGWFGDIVRTWLPAILAVLLIRTYVFEPFRIPSGSMIPTLLVGDHVVVNKASYGLWVPTIVVEIPFMENLGIVPDRYEVLDWADPQRGDIIVFRYPQNPEIHYIKRVVAVPGDKIRVENNQIFLNGQPMAQDPQATYTTVDDGCTELPAKRFIEDLSGLSHNVLTNLSSGGHLSDKPRADLLVPERSVFVMGDNRDNSEDSRAWGMVRYDQIKGKAHFVWFSWDSCASGVRPKRFFRSLYQLYAD